jgi:2-succinyl-5-enolpyruvyl-6-hydroxy-3-cyclohexene-1-carboxylate synthase
MELLNAIQSGNKIWFVAGMNRPDQGLERVIRSLQDLQIGWIWREDLANIKAGLPVRDEWFKASSRYAMSLGEASDGETADGEASLGRPTLLISWGGPLISKYLQLFLRDYPRFKHWRIDPRGDHIDTYNRLDGVWKAFPEPALKSLHNIIDDFLQKNTRNSQIQTGINSHEGETAQTEGFELPSLKASVVDFDQTMRDRYPDLPYSDSLALSVILPKLHGCRVHLGNSSLVRKFLALPWDKSDLLSIHCNRGTSGIEGNISTAIGEAWAHPEDSVWILNGDLATAYDAGAWLLEPRPPVRLVVLNNGGGDIFRQIPGASVQPECEQHFATPRNIRWSSWCRGYGLPYRLATDLASLHDCLTWLSELPGAGFLEILTSPSFNRKAEKILRTGFDEST